jgi:hypothetical protein
VVEVAETICCTGSEWLIQQIEQHIRLEFERVSQRMDKKGMAIYGLLGAMLKDKPVADVAWPQKLSQQFSLPELSVVEHQTLFNENGVNVQMQFFYDDDDGSKSFTNFLASYRNDPNWSIADHQRYVVVSSVKGSRVEIYANHPGYEVNGQQAIFDLFDEQGISPSIVIHRGHSYYTMRTLDRVPAETRILLLGSCGAYHLLTGIMERMPHLHILASKQIGTMNVNDPVFKMLNEDLRNGHDIYWPDLWQRAEAKVGSNPYFDDYVAPHENVGSLFIQAYYTVLGVI